MTNEISNSDDIIDSRDVIARIDEMESERQDLVDAVDEAEDGFPAEEDLDAYSEAKATHAAAEKALAEWDDDNGDELKALQSLANDASNYADDWRHGAALIRDSYFTEYAEEMLKDCGDLPQNIPAYIVIDWEATATNIQQDYTSVDFAGETYWIR